jgi:2-desacetyl-2-hydroxyethyl bacteriochlorophyllide A dehydrogenase
VSVTQLPSTMRAWRRFAAGDVRLVEVERPRPGAGEVVIRPLVSGVCGTDLHVLHGEGLGELPVPLTMGHEVCGEVVELGPGADAPGPYPRHGSALRVGERVVVEPVLPCGNCYFCRRGHPNVCPNMSHLGVWRDGNYADFVAVPAWRATRLPDSVDDVSGLLVEVTACGLNCVDQAGVKPGETALVIGGGPMGHMAAQCLVAAGAGLVMLSEPSRERRALAQRAGVNATWSPETDDVVARVRELTSGLGADVVVECVGRPVTVQQALDATRRRGTCVLNGLPSAAVTVDITELVFGEKRVVGSLASAWQFERAIDLIASGRLRPRLMVDTPRPFAELPSALADARDRRDLGKLVVAHADG